MNKPQSLPNSVIGQLAQGSIAFLRGALQDLVSIYLVSVDMRTPMSVRITLAGCIICLFLPLEHIPFIGFLLNAAAIAKASFTVAETLLPDQREQARHQVSSWLGYPPHTPKKPSVIDV